MWPIHLDFRLLISCRIFLCSLALSNTYSFSYDRSNRSSPSFPSTTFRNFPGVSDLLFEASKFQHRIKLCSKCNILLLSFSMLNPMCTLHLYVNQSIYCGFLLQLISLERFCNWTDFCLLAQEILLSVKNLPVFRNIGPILSSQCKK